MQKYDVTLTLSKKHIPIYADSYEKAMAQIGDMVAGLVLKRALRACWEMASIQRRERGAVPKPGGG